jgi:predicted nucleic acid-binding protein
VIAWALVPEATRREVQASALYVLEKRLRRVEAQLRRALTKREVNQLNDRRRRILRALEAAWRLV